MNEIDGIGAYGLAWLETDPALRMVHLHRGWAEEAVYCDPLTHVQGRQALSDHIGATQVGLVGGSIPVTAEAVRHHDSACFPWAVLDAAGATVMTGFDVVQLDAEGRITRLTGFFD